MLVDGLSWLAPWSMNLHLKPLPSTRNDLMKVRKVFFTIRCYPNKVGGGSGFGLETFDALGSEGGSYSTACILSSGNTLSRLRTSSSFVACSQRSQFPFSIQC